ncbi:MAG: hypothetical protein AAFX06_20690 [Planctomycetota bacterium]
MINDFEQYRDSIAILVDFVSGEVNGAELQAALEKPEMAQLLSHFENPRYPATSNHYRRLQKLERESMKGLWNSQDVIEDFLTQAEVEFTASTQYSDTARLVLDALPSYLDPPMEFVIPLIPDDPGMSKTKKKQVLKQLLKEAFPCAGKPPRWVQSPDWPIVEGRPLLFIGQVQIDVPDLFHDSGFVYIFYSTADSEFKTIAQFH